MSSVITAVRRAGQHPWLLLAFFCLRSAFAAGGALLWSGAFAPAWIMGLPDRDASLFEPGLLLPIRLFAENRQRWIERAWASLWLALVYMTASAIVTALVLHALNRASRAGKARRVWPSLWSQVRQLAAVGVSWICVLIAVYVAQLLARFVPVLVYQFAGEKAADMALVVLIVVLGLAIVFLRIGCDLTRAVLSHSRCSSAQIVATVTGELRARWGLWISRYAGFVLPALGMPLLVGISFPAFGNGLPLGLGRFLVHQAVVLACCGLQLGWWVLVLMHAPVPNQPEEWHDT